MVIGTQGEDKKRPSEPSLAFAVSVVLSKPSELTLREYIRLLNQHIAKGRRQNAISTAYRHLDRSSYWRSEYERLKDALKESESENTDLKIENAELKAKLESAKPASSTKKRKKPDEDVVPVPRSPKKSKVEISSSKQPKTSFDTFGDYNFSDLGEIGNILTRSFYQIHVILKGTEKTEPAALAHLSVRAASAVPQVVQKALQSNTSDNDFLKAVLTAAGRAAHILIAASNRLGRVANGNEVQGHVTYAYVHMFRKLLEILDEAAVTEVSKISNVKTHASPLKKQPPSKVKSSPQKSLAIGDNAMLNLLTKFLCSILENLDSKVEAHKSLYEGCTYVVLSKVGPALYTLVFGHSRGETMAEEINISGQSDEIEDTTDTPELSPEEKQIKATKLKVPYLVHLLNRAMNAAPAQLGAITSSKTGKAKQANNKGSLKGALTMAAKERLQRTLVNCIFGTEGVDEDDPFMDCLKMPIMDRRPLPMPKVKEPEMHEWFKEEVWRLLGWELLMKDEW